MFTALWQSALILLPARFQTADGPADLVGRALKPAPGKHLSLQQVLVHNAEVQATTRAIAQAQAAVTAHASGAWSERNAQAMLSLTEEAVSAEHRSAVPVWTPEPVQITAPMQITEPVQIAAPIRMDASEPDFEVIPDHILGLMEDHYDALDSVPYDFEALDITFTPQRSDMQGDVECAPLAGLPAPTELERLSQEQATREAHIASLTTGALDLPDLDGIDVPDPAAALLTALRGRGQQTIHASLQASLQGQLAASALNAQGAQLTA